MISPGIVRDSLSHDCRMSLSSPDPPFLKVFIMRQFVTAFMALVLLAPQTGFGGPIEQATISIKLEEPTLIAFGTGGCQMIWNFITSISGYGPDLLMRRSELSFQSNTLLSLTVDDDGWGSVVEAHYVFGPGSASITASWWEGDIGVNPGTGYWEGEMLGATFDTREYPDDSFGSVAEADVQFGAGTFDDALANALGVIRETSSGWFRMAIDQIDGDPSSDYRVGGSRSGIDYAELHGADLPSPVPEPQTWSSLLVGIASLMGWRLCGKSAPAVAKEKDCGA